MGNVLFEHGSERVERPETQKLFADVPCFVPADPGRHHGRVAVPDPDWVQRSRRSPAQVHRPAHHCPHHHPGGDIFVHGSRQFLRLAFVYLSMNIRIYSCDQYINK